ncbi:MAG: hypothetical protein JW944_14545 [Deltaproteobacteria bacterium]|nr:hypothetical protein [Deltaproteobacteria bacterium]
MKDTKTVSRITAYLHRNISKDVINALKDTGVQDLYLSPSRSLVIEVKKGIFSILPGNDLSQDATDTVFFLVNSDTADYLVSLIIEKGGLYFQGRGSVMAEEVQLMEGHKLCRENEINPFEKIVLPVTMHPCTGICCIARRGQGDHIARVSLDTGAGVPSIHFGIGTGVRNKMGLLRITIPAEKEIIHSFTTPYEADSIMDLMIEAGRLDQPGSGFIYAYPVKKGLINMRVARGEQRHAASIEQIISALDHIKGNIDWRQRTHGVDKRNGHRKRYISGLVDMILLCDDGTGTGLIKAAMSAGAGGANITFLRHIRPYDSPLNEISPARDLCSMVVPEETVEGVIKALEEAGVFTDRCHGQIYLRKILKAFTYIEKK